MLGFFFVVLKQSDLQKAPAERAPLATWYASLGGTSWIDSLVASGKAVDLEGNGYPLRYTVSAETLIQALRSGPPKHESPPVLGDDYYLPAGWTGDSTLDLPALQALDISETLFIEAWDLS